MSDAVTDYKQAKRFLSILENMGPESQQSFRKIYAQAPKGVKKPHSISSGRHVRTAMLEALQHPQIAYWVRMNLALRVARKFSQVTGQAEQLARLETLLEDFHVASEAFIFKLPVEQVALRRKQKQEAVLPITALQSPIPGLIPPEISDEDLAGILQFKQRVIPGFIQGIRQKQVQSL